MVTAKFAMSHPAPRNHYRVSFVLLAVAVGSFAMVQSMTIPMLSRIETELNTDQSTVTWVLTAYLLSASVFTPIVGRLGDAHGKKRMIVLSLIALSVGSMLAALAGNIGVMLLARVVQGAGGGVFPLAFGIIRDEFPRARVAGAVSFVSSLASVGFGIGIVLSGPITNGLGYAWLFWLPMIVTAVSALGAALFVPESPIRTPGGIPVLPALLLSGWLICLLLALSEAPKWGWGSFKVIGLMIAAVVVVVAWVKVEQRVPVPLIDMRMMRLKPVWTTNLVALLVGVGMYASFGFLPQFLQTPTSTGYGMGASVTESGLLLLPMVVASFLTGIVAAPLSRRVGPKFVVIAGCLIASGGLTLTALVHDTRLELAVAAALLGLGMGLAFACLAMLIVAAVPAAQTGVASGMNANIRTIGGSVGSAAMASVATAHLASGGFPHESGYTIGFLGLAGTTALAALAGLSIPSVSGRRGRRRPLEAVDYDVAIVGA